VRSAKFWLRHIKFRNDALTPFRLAPWAVAVLCGGLACTGSIVGGDVDNPIPSSGGSRGDSEPSAGGTGGGTPGPDEVPAETCTDTDVGPGVLRRLTRFEYLSTVQDLLALDSVPSLDALPPDAEAGGFTTVAELQSVSAQHVGVYVDSAEALARALMANAARREKVVGCDISQDTCLDDFLKRFGARTFRRPLEADELTSLRSRALELAEDESDRFVVAITALLSAPSFLYRVELGDAEKDGIARLSPTELASRLAFALWGRGPDDELLQSALEGGLDDDSGLRATVKTMLEDQRTKEFQGELFRQWLHYGEQRPPNEAPEGWSPDLMPAVVEETRRFLDALAWEGGDFFELLTANHTYANSALASYYDLPVPADEWGRVEFSARSNRAGSGILTHPSVLSAKADGDPVSVRGAWLFETFLCQELIVPAELIETLSDDLEGLSYLEIVKRRNTETACSGCHRLIDPIGVAYSQYDSTGRYDPGVDTSVFGIQQRLEGSKEPSFSSIGQLGQQLRALPKVTNCLAKKAFSFFNGRAPTRADKCAVERLAKAFTDSGNLFPALLEGLVTDPAFALQRSKE